MKLGDWYREDERREREWCSACNGEGVTDEEVCEECGGSGLTSPRERFYDGQFRASLSRERPTPASAPLGPFSGGDQ